MSSNSTSGSVLSRRSLAVAIGMALTAGSAQADTFSVTTTDDSGAGSFREAIQSANGNIGADIIDFSAVSGQTITLASNLPVIGDDLTLQGSDVTLDGDAQHSCLAAEFGNLTVEDMTITNCVGSDLGGQGVRGTLAYGGGIRVDNGDLTVTGSTISNNAPAAAAPERGQGGSGLVGGGIWVVGGSLTVSDSVITGNTAEDGGGILHYGIGGPVRGDQPAGEPVPSNLSISRSVISDNSANNSGGGVMSFSSYANVEIDETEIVGNQAGDGGGLFMFGDGTSMTLSNSTVSGNSAASGAGAALMLNKYPGNIELSNNTISNNTADFIGGLYLTVDSMQPQGATPTGLQPPVLLVGQTITGNTATYGIGGGLTAPFQQPTTVLIGNSIIAGNSAATGSGDLSASTPQGLLHSGLSERVAERFGRAQTAGGGPGNTTFEVGFSIVGEAPDDGSNFSPDTVSANLLGEDPELGPLADNGGPTSTHLPAATSPALDIVTAAGACGAGFDLDQRGEPRPEAGGTLCDAGSVERGAPPLIDANPDIAFGTVDVGDSAGPETVTLANNGGTPLDVTAFNGMAAPFTLDFSDCAASLPFSLAAGESCSLLAGFSPTSAGAFAQTVTVESNSGVGGDDSFELSGTGVVPAIAADPLDFGGVPVGQSVPGTVTIENTGQGSLEVSGLSLSDTAGGVFALGADTCGAPIAAGGSCDVTIDFTPAAAGAFNGSLAVESNAAAEPLEVALSGEGLIGNLVITPGGGLNFGDVPVGESGQADLTLGNDGDAPVEVNGWPDPAAPFSIVGGTCPTAPFTLAPGETCTLTFGFAPASQGDYGETLDFSVNEGSGGASVPVSVSGRGTAPAAPAVPIPTLDRIGLIIGGGLLALMGLLGLRRRHGGGSA